jgi:hypothetical protein
MMKSADIKKGMRFQLANGWYATMMDNKKGVTRVAEVEGFYTEIGSVYSHDIYRVLVDGVWHQVDYTEKELKCRQQAEMFSI